MVKKLVRDLDDFDSFLFEQPGEQPGVVLDYYSQRIVKDMRRNLPGDWIVVKAWDGNGDCWEVFYRLDEEVEIVDRLGGYLDPNN